jgi:hypothetical protein
VATVSGLHQPETRGRWIPEWLSPTSLLSAAGWQSRDRAEWGLKERSLWVSLCGTAAK